MDRCRRKSRHCRRRRRATRIVLARPTHGETGRGLDGRQRADAAAGRAGVDRVQGLFVRVDSLARVMVVEQVGRDRRLLQVECDQRDVADLGAGRQARLGLNDVAEEAHSAAGAILGGQEAGEDVGRKLGIGIDRKEVCEDQPCGAVQTQLDRDVERRAVVGHRNRGREILASRWDRNNRVAEADLGELERRPVEVGVQLIGDVNRCAARWPSVHSRSLEDPEARYLERRSRRGPNPAGPTSELGSSE